MLTDNSNWFQWGNSSPLNAVWGKEFVKDMANLYSSTGDATMQMTQAELCSLEEALNDALSSAPWSARSGFHSNFINFIENSNTYDSVFTDKLKGWILQNNPSFINR